MLPGEPQHTEKDWLALLFLGTHREGKIKLYAFKVMNES